MHTCSQLVLVLRLLLLQDDWAAIPDNATSQAARPITSAAINFTRFIYMYIIMHVHSTSVSICGSDVDL